MSLNPKDVEKLCELARLEVTAEEMADVSAKLSDIMAMANQLQAVAAKEVAPMAHPLDRPQRLREDRVTERDEHELYQRNAASVERDLYLVPKVIE